MPTGHIHIPAFFLMLIFQRTFVLSTLITDITYMHVSVKGLARLDSKMPRIATKWFITSKLTDMDKFGS